MTMMQPTLHTIIRVALVPFIAAFVLVAGAQAGEVFKKRSWDHALNGYDAVAYHAQSEAVKGNDAYTTEYLGETWTFSSQANLDSFKENPDAYRPAYGGHCAWAMSKGKKAAGNPTVWHIYEGTLYLNISRGIQKKWLKDIPGFIERADAKWPAVRASL